MARSQEITGMENYERSFSSGLPRQPGFFENSKISSPSPIPIVDFNEMPIELRRVSYPFTRLYM
jgi:hypothetical protein